MSLDNPNPKIPGKDQANFDDDALIKAIAAEAIRNCGLSRDQIADQMSILVGKPITLRMLNHWTAYGEQTSRWPLCYTRAFCQVVGDWRLLGSIAELGGLQIISSEDALFLELGKQYFNRKRTDAQLHELEILIQSGRRR
jgi:hypothetical protein